MTTTDIQTQILQTNPILEAFGNAKTVRNDNSSRFGKFIALQFGADAKMVGAKISVYLLEKIRLSHQSLGERNFHIFYELCAGADDDLADALELGGMEDYAILSQSECYERRSVDDAVQFNLTTQAFRDMGVPDDETTTILSVVASLLHLGNVAFDAVTSSSSNLEMAAIAASSAAHLSTASRLLGVSSEALVTALVTRRIHTTREVVEVKLTAAQAEDAKQSLMQSIYGGLFLYIVERLSNIICHDRACVTTIGILDIFGFENLHSNGFEQLCINYANERLQAQFNDLVFAKEQRMYASEGIEWKYIEFPDNAPCLQLLEDRPAGMWCLLDEECILPKGSNEAWITKLYQTFLPPDETISESRRHSNPERGQLKKPPSGPKPTRPFYASHTQQVAYQFVIGHFAGRVMYELDAFLQKNQDALPTEAIGLCNASSSLLVQSLLKAKVPAKAAVAPRLARVPSSLRAASVSAQFKSQLDELIGVIGSTQARYIRCVKSNDTAEPRCLHKARVVQQLRSGGVLEAVRIARAGYAVRVDHASFVEQFGFVLPSSPRKATVLPIKTKCERIAATLLLECGDHTDVAKRVLSALTYDRAAFQDACGRAGFQLGVSKIFFRKEVYNTLRLRRRQKLSASATHIQRVYRGYRAAKAYAIARAAIAALQAFARQLLARRRLQRRSATRMQATWRRYAAVRRWTLLRRGVAACQRFWRSRAVWRRAMAERETAKRLELEALAQAQAAVDEQRRADDRRRAAELEVERSMPTPTLSPRRGTSPVVNAVSSVVHGASPVVATVSLPQSTTTTTTTVLTDSATAALVENLTLQNEKLRLELELLRQQTTTTSALVPRAVDELAFAHQQIVSLSQQLLTTQIRYSNLLLDYNESVHGYDADRPSLSEDAFSMVDDLAVPCPDTLECAQEQLRTLLRKLHAAKEKLKHLEADRVRKPRGDSIEGLEFYPRKSTEWRPAFYPPLDELGYDSDADEYDSRVDELQRQVDSLRTCMHTKRSLASLPSTVSTASDFVERRPTSRLTYHVRDISKWARDAVCFECKTEFTWFTRRHHCRLCGHSFCHEHSNRRACLVGCGAEDESEPVRVCDVCFVEICVEARKSEAASRRFPQFV
ncbi:hypothetical protein SPRG_08351 [Saprolegnia parasitica CBS 223.65]|uniref:FYVE-type domain-containing protein n=1 Tax=Saprolegnia parasitica (strain CBS 223.65) TaxID=695850 RepID=A0A067CIC0_SAPPC|nr:hypothetical protein SPRG_08351 [Saprolegnia parasitica CBS 223.65]KDO26276.1 hypothetical protein SPRG_08351 [Saprolegnia parasitica CBS 223.65]|eukprot:XP_012202982.1 hypothetical protein SPRG_08351 [Saprolegnia parasitica CBS 223.65]